MIPNYTFRFICSLVLILIGIWAVYSLFALMTLLEENMPEAKEFASFCINWICIPFVVFLFGFLVKRLLLVKQNRSREMLKNSIRPVSKSVVLHELNFVLAAFFAIISIRIIFVLFTIATTPLADLEGKSDLFWEFFF